jgi:hypothetical protein
LIGLWVGGKIIRYVGESKIPVLAPWTLLVLAPWTLLLLLTLLTLLTRLLLTRLLLTRLLLTLLLARRVPAESPKRHPHVLRVPQLLILCRHAGVRHIAG